MNEETEWTKDEKIPVTFSEVMKLELEPDGNLYAHTRTFSYDERGRLVAVGPNTVKVVEKEK